MSDFPTTVTTNADPTSGNTLANAPHAEQHQSHNAEIKATQTKLGTGASTPANNTFLIGNGVGTSAYSALTSAQLAARISDETGSGAVVFGTAPTISAPVVSTGTFTSPVLTTPAIVTSINDANGNAVIKTPATGAAVNQLTVTNAATGNSPDVSVTGNDSNIGLTLTPKGTSGVSVTKRFDGWVTGLPTPNTVTANGNHSYSCVFNSVDLTGYLSAGMRLRTTRTVAAPTQCTSLNGTTQYYSKTSPANMAQTDKITESIWIKPDTYKTAGMISRNNGTTDGWKFYLNSSGQVVLQGARAGDDVVTSYQSVPLNKWTHVSASIDTTTTTGVIEIDGVTVPSSYTNNANTGFAAPTTAYLIGATNSASPTDFFSGKIAQAASFNVVISVATLLTYLSQGYAGTETSLVSAYSFNNSIADLNANANNLTANGSAVATNADSPFGGQAGGSISSTLDYGIITSASFSTNTTLVVQVPEGCTIPTSGGVSAVSYSTVGVPYGFPKQKGKWKISCIEKVQVTQGSAVSGTWYNVGSQQITMPIGEWEFGYQTSPILTSSTTAIQYQTLSTANNTESDQEYTTEQYLGSAANIGVPRSKIRSLSLAAQTVYYLNQKQSSGTSTTLFNIDTGTSSIVEAELALL